MNLGILKVLNWPLRYFGLRIRPISSEKIDYCGRNEKFIYAKFLHHSGGVIVDLPLARSRWKAMPIPYNSAHPFVKSIMDALDGEENLNQKKLRNGLQTYYEMVQPERIRECTVFDLKNQENVRSHRVSWPWLPRSPKEIEKTPIYVNNKIVLMNANDHGVQHWGPVSKEKLRTEILKFTKLFNSVKYNGYVSDRHVADGVVRCYILERTDGEWVWIPFQGQHRVAVASALKFHAIPVSVEAIYRERDVHLFSQVLDGSFSQSEARKCFNLYFEGQVPIAALKNWKEKSGA